MQADEPHRGGIQGHRIAARHQHIEIDRIAVDWAAPLHADQPVHDAERDRPQLVNGADELVQVLVQQNAVIARNAAPLVFECPGEDRRGVRLENRKRDEDIRI